MLARDLAHQGVSKFFCNAVPKLEALEHGFPCGGRHDRSKGTRAMSRIQRSMMLVGAAAIVLQLVPATGSAYCLGPDNWPWSSPTTSKTMA